MGDSQSRRGRAATSSLSYTDMNLIFYTLLLFLATLTATSSRGRGLVLNKGQEDGDIGDRNKRARNYNLWRGFGSDGYLYDFVKRSSIGARTRRGARDLRSYFRQPKYQYWSGHGSDGYLYDFVRK